MNSTGPRIDNPILRLSREHNLIITYMTRLEGLLVSGTTKNLAAEIESIFSSLREAMFGHFVIEEKIIFKAMLLELRDPRLADVIISMCRDHGMLMATIDYMREFSKYAELHKPKGNPFIDKFVEMTATFVETTKRHARVEVMDLFPEADKSSACIERIQTLFAELTLSSAARP